MLDDSAHAAPPTVAVDTIAGPIRPRVAVEGKGRAPGCLPDRSDGLRDGERARLAELVRKESQVLGKGGRPHAHTLTSLHRERERERTKASTPALIPSANDRKRTSDDPGRVHLGMLQF